MEGKDSGCAISNPDDRISNLDWKCDKLLLPLKRLPRIDYRVMIENRDSIKPWMACFDRTHEKCDGQLFRYYGTVLYRAGSMGQECFGKMVSPIGVHVKNRDARPRCWPGFLRHSLLTHWIVIKARQPLSPFPRTEKGESEDRNQKSRSRRSWSQGSESQKSDRRNPAVLFVAS